MSLKMNNILHFCARLVVGTIFIVAGLQKMADPAGFAVVIAGYGLTPAWANYPLAIFFPVLEVASGLGLILNVRWALELVAAQLLLFVGVLSYGIHLGLDVDCGCFGPEDPEGEAYHGLREALMRDAAMIAACAWVAWRSRIAGPFPRGFGEVYATIKNRVRGG